MNKINPLYMLAFFALVSIVMMIKTASLQDEIIRTSQDNAHLEIQGQYISILKSKWKDSKKSKQRLERILSHSSIKGNVVSKNFKKGLYKVELTNLDVRSLDSFVNKLLGETLEIKSLQINRISDKNASVVVECLI